MDRFTKALTFLQPWVGDSLTPYWIVCLGVAAGLVVLLLLWGLAKLVSAIPGVATIAEKPGPRLVAALILGAIIFVIALPLCWPAIAVTEAGGKETSDHYESVGLWLGLLAAGSFMCGVAGVTLVGRRATDEVPLAIKEGALLPIFVAFLILAAFGVLGVTAVKDPGDILASLARLPASGVTPYSYTIEPAVAGDDEELPAQPISVSFRGDEVQRMAFDSDQPVDVSLVPFDKDSTQSVLKVLPQEQFLWLKSGQTSNPLPAKHLDTLYVRNMGSSDANLKLTVLTGPPYPEISTLPLTAAAVCLLFLAYMLQRTLMPKLSAVALATTKSEMAQPMFLMLLGGGISLLIVFVYLPYNTFGEDIKMLKESGITLITVLCVVQAVWAASNSISEEIEGRTALTVLSKPIGRREFILGKYLGILWTVLVLSIFLGLVFLVAVGYKPIYDAKESSADGAPWQQCHAEMLRVVPGLVLGFMETAVLAALSVAISTRLPMLANFLICFSIYTLGHLTPLIVQSSVAKFEIVDFFGRFIATIFPVLDHFKIEAAVAGGADVPYEYLGWSLLYCLLYGAIALLLALVMFEDRDLA